MATFTERARQAGRAGVFLGKSAYGVGSFAARTAYFAARTAYGVGKTTYKVGKWWTGTRPHKAGMDWVKAELGIGIKSPLWRWLGRGFVGLSAFQGYQEGGTTGAITATAAHLGTTYALGAGMKMLGVSLPALALVGTGAGYLAANRAAREHRKRFSNVEMTRPVVDQFGTISTMRQRSQMAMRNSKLNSAGMLGQEASLRYTPYNR